MKFTIPIILISLLAAGCSSSDQNRLDAEENAGLIISELSKYYPSVSGGLINNYVTENGIRMDRLNVYYEKSQNRDRFRRQFIINADASGYCVAKGYSIPTYKRDGSRTSSPSDYVYSSGYRNDLERDSSCPGAFVRYE